MRREWNLDGVGKGQSNYVAGLNTGGDEARGSTFDELMKGSMSKIKFAGNGNGTAGGKFFSNVFQ